MLHYILYCLAVLLRELMEWAIFLPRYVLVERHDHASWLWGSRAEACVLPCTATGTGSIRGAAAACSRYSPPSAPTAPTAIVRPHQRMGCLPGYIAVPTAAAKNKRGHSLEAPLYSRQSRVWSRKREGKRRRRKREGGQGEHLMRDRAAAGHLSNQDGSRDHDRVNRVELARTPTSRSEEEGLVNSAVFDSSAASLSDGDERSGFRTGPRRHHLSSVSSSSSHPRTPASGSSLSSSRWMESTGSLTLSGSSNSHSFSSSYSSASSGYSSRRSYGRGEDDTTDGKEKGGNEILLSGFSTSSSSLSSSLCSSGVNSNDSRSCSGDNADTLWRSPESLNTGSHAGSPYTRRHWVPHKSQQTRRPSFRETDNTVATAPAAETVSDATPRHHCHGHQGRRKRHRHSHHRHHLRHDDHRHYPQRRRVATGHLLTGLFTASGLPWRGLPERFLDTRSEPTGGHSSPVGADGDAPALGIWRPRHYRRAVYAKTPADESPNAKNGSTGAAERADLNSMCFTLRCRTLNDRSDALRRYRLSRRRGFVPPWYAVGPRSQLLVASADPLGQLCLDLLTPHHAPQRYPQRGGTDVGVSGRAADGNSGRFLHGNDGAQVDHSVENADMLAMSLRIAAHAVTDAVDGTWAGGVDSNSGSASGVGQLSSATNTKGNHHGSIMSRVCLFCVRQAQSLVEAVLIWLFGAATAVGRECGTLQQPPPLILRGPAARAVLHKGKIPTVSRTGAADEVKGKDTAEVGSATKASGASKASSGSYAAALLPIAYAMTFPPVAHEVCHSTTTGVIQSNPAHGLKAATAAAPATSPTATTTSAGVETAAKRPPAVPKTSTSRGVAYRPHGLVLGANAAASPTSTSNPPIIYPTAPSAASTTTATAAHTTAPTRADTSSAVADSQRASPDRSHSSGSPPMGSSTSRPQLAALSSSAVTGFGVGSAAGAGKPNHSTSTTSSSSVAYERRTGVSWLHGRAPDTVATGPIVVLLLCPSIIQGGARGHAMRRLSRLCECLSVIGALRYESDAAPTANVSGGVGRGSERAGALEWESRDAQAEKQQRKWRRALRALRYAQWYAAIASSTASRRGESTSGATFANGQNSQRNKDRVPTDEENEERRGEQEGAAAWEDAWATPLTRVDVAHITSTLRRRLASVVAPTGTGVPTTEKCSNATPAHRLVFIVGVGWSEGAGPLLESAITRGPASGLDGLFCLSHTLSSHLPLVSDPAPNIITASALTTTSTLRGAVGAARQPSLAPLLFHSHLLSQPGRGAARLLLLVTRLQLIAAGVHRAQCAFVASARAPHHDHDGVPVQNEEDARCERSSGRRQPRGSNATTTVTADAARPSKHKRGPRVDSASYHQSSNGNSRSTSAMQTEAGNFFADALAALYRARRSVNREMRGMDVATRAMVLQAAAQEEVGEGDGGATGMVTASAAAASRLCNGVGIRSLALPYPFLAVNPRALTATNREAAAVAAAARLRAVPSTLDWEILLQHHQPPPSQQQQLLPMPLPGTPLASVPLTRRTPTTPSARMAAGGNGDVFRSGGGTQPHPLPIAASPVTGLSFPRFTPTGAAPSLMTPTSATALPTTVGGMASRDRSASPFYSSSLTAGHLSGLSPRAATTEDLAEMANLHASDSCHGSPLHSLSSTQQQQPQHQSQFFPRLRAMASSSHVAAFSLTSPNPNPALSIASNSNSNSSAYGNGNGGGGDSAEPAGDRYSTARQGPVIRRRATFLYEMAAAQPSTHNYTSPTTIADTAAGTSTTLVMADVASATATGTVTDKGLYTAAASMAGEASRAHDGAHMFDADADAWQCRRPENATEDDTLVCFPRYRNTTHSRTGGGGGDGKGGRSRRRRHRLATAAAVALPSTTHVPRAMAAAPATTSAASPEGHFTPSPAAAAQASFVAPMDLQALIELRVRSAEHVCARLAVPTLFLHSRDDDVAPISSLPLRPLQANPHVTIVLTRRGGHGVFVEHLRDAWRDPQLIAVIDDEKVRKTDTGHDGGGGSAPTSVTGLRIEGATWVEQLLIEYVASAVLGGW